MGVRAHLLQAVSASSRSAMTSTQAAPVGKSPGSASISTPSASASSASATQSSAGAPVSAPAEGGRGREHLRAGALAFDSDSLQRRRGLLVARAERDGVQLDRA